MQRIDGVTGAAPIWYHSMLDAEQSKPKTPFAVPPGVHQATYTSNGVTSTDWFMDGPIIPQNIGPTGPSYTPCIIYTKDETNPWNYCPPGYTGTQSATNGTPGATPTPTVVDVPG